MKLFKNMSNDMNDYVLMGILLLFILFDIKVPYLFARFIDTFLGKLVLVLVVISMLYVNPILGIIASVAVYELLNRSKYAVDMDVRDMYLPSEKNKEREIMKMNVAPDHSLEHKAVNQMKKRQIIPALGSPGFSPMLNRMHNAARL